MCEDASSPQTDTQIQCNSNKNPNRFFVELDKLILKFLWRRKESRLAKTIPKKKNKVRRTALADTKSPYKTVWRCRWGRPSSALKYQEQIPCLNGDRFVTEVLLLFWLGKEWPLQYMALEQRDRPVRVDEMGPLSHIDTNTNSIWHRYWSLKDRIVKCENNIGKYTWFHMRKDFSNLKMLVEWKIGKFNYMYYKSSVDN